MRCDCALLGLWGGGGGADVESATLLLQVKCGLLKSFGFGQVGGELLLVHADYILATLSASEYQLYSALRARREAAYYRATHDGLTGVQPIVRIKNDAPYTAAQMQSVYLDPTARARYDASRQTWSFEQYKGPSEAHPAEDTKVAEEVPPPSALRETARAFLYGQFPPTAPVACSVAAEVQLEPSGPAQMQGMGPHKECGSAGPRTLTSPPPPEGGLQPTVSCHRCCP